MYNVGQLVLHACMYMYMGFLGFFLFLSVSLLVCYTHIMYIYTCMYMYNMFMHISVAAVVSEPLSGSSGKSSPGSSPGEEVATSPTHLQLQHPTVQDLPAGTCTCAPVHVYMLHTCIIHIHIYMYMYIHVYTMLPW